MFDVAVIGAGMAGLSCAQQLQQAGYKVVVVEKSRGLGGRVATRRLQGTCADHGVRYLEQQGEFTEQLIQKLSDRGLLHLWLDTIYELDSNGCLQPSADRRWRYISPDGMTAIAKFLASGLEIWRNQRVTAIAPTAEHRWKLTLDLANADSAPDLTARAIVAAIPAPQALMLLEPLVGAGLPLELIAALRSVRFAPCFTAIATYASDRQKDLDELPWRAVNFAHDSALAWMSLDSSKRLDPPQPVFVLQSAADFAQQQLESTDLSAIGHQLLDRAAQLLPWLAEPELLQVHRWRYAFATHPSSALCLSTDIPVPLVCSGDWCGGDRVEAALISGHTAATKINLYLNNLNPPDEKSL